MAYGIVAATGKADRPLCLAVRDPPASVFPLQNFVLGQTSGPRLPAETVRECPRRRPQFHNMSEENGLKVREWRLAEEAIFGGVVPFRTGVHPNLIGFCPLFFWMEDVIDVSPVLIAQADHSQCGIGRSALGRQS